MRTPKKTDLETSSTSASSDYSQQPSPGTSSARSTPDSTSGRTSSESTSGRTTPEPPLSDDLPEGSVERLEAIQRHCSAFKPPYDNEVVPCIEGVKSITVHADTWGPPTLKDHCKVEINLLGNEEDDVEVAKYNDREFMLQSADTLGDVEQITVSSTKYNIVVARDLITTFLNAFEYLGRSKAVDHDPCLFKTIALEIFGEKFGNTKHAVKLWENVFMGFNAIRVLLAEKIRRPSEGKASPVRDNIEHYLNLVRDFEKDVWRALPEDQKIHLRTSFTKNKNRNALQHLEMVEFGSPYRNKFRERIGVSPLLDSPRSELSSCVFPDLLGDGDDPVRGHYQVLKKIQRSPKKGSLPQINDARKAYHNLIASSHNRTKGDSPAAKVPRVVPRK